MSDQPNVGIALAVYKPNVDFFVQQLQSIANQDYRNWFCILSFDSSIEELKAEPRLQPFLKDPRFEIRSNNGERGSIENFESTTKLCLERNPNFIAFSDQDDIWYPHKLSTLVSAILKLPPLSIVHCDMNVIVGSSTGQFVELPETAWVTERRGVRQSSPTDFLIRNMAAGAGMLVDAEIPRRYPKIPAREFAHDHWYSLIASYFGSIEPIFEPLYAYRIHGKNVAGLSAYNGFFSASSSSKRLGVFAKCRGVYNLSKARAITAANAGLPVSVLQRTMLISKWDLGLLYLAKALITIFMDRALARACVARAIGKVVRIFQPDEDEYSVW